MAGMRVERLDGVEAVEEVLVQPETIPHLPRARMAVSELLGRREALRARQERTGPVEVEGRVVRRVRKAEREASVQNTMIILAQPMMD